MKKRISKETILWIIFYSSLLFVFGVACFIFAVVLPYVYPYECVSEGIVEKVEYLSSDKEGEHGITILTFTDKTTFVCCKELLSVPVNRYILVLYGQWQTPQYKIVKKEFIPENNNMAGD